MDIRRIDLSKKFSISSDDRFKYCDKDGWIVWGYYDFLTVESIQINPETLFLHSILEDSHIRSQQVDGETKHHVIYAIDALERNNTHFWTPTEMPFFLVSLIHVETDSFSVPQSIVALENELESKGGNQYSAIVYTGIDSSDLIIFWRTWSIETVLKRIVDMCNRNSERFREIFTIQSCARAYLDNSKPQMPKEIQLADKLSRVTIYLRGDTFSHLCSVAKTIAKNLASNSVKAEVFFVPGQEDICIDFSNCSVDTFLKIYNEKGDIHKAGISSRAEIRTIWDDGYSIKEPDNSTNREDHRSDGYYFSTVINRIVEKHPEIKEAMWFPPLCELINEFSNMASSNTTDDIYYQGINSLFSLLYLLEQSAQNQTLTTCDSTTYGLLKYVRGWSQLSFHAMRAQWQLTQTADINRLYIFSAKMGLIYHGFMTQVGDLLHSNKQKYEPQVIPKCNYFLTPQVCQNASFLSIFLDETSVSHLILGEIPAELFFKPDILLPVLVHEAAHYSGTYPRNRSKRNKCILLSTIEYIVVRSVKSSVWKSMPDQNKSDIVNNITFSLWPSLEDEYKKIAGPSFDGYSRYAKGYINTCLASFIDQFGGIQSLVKWLAHMISLEYAPNAGMIEGHDIEQSMLIGAVSSERIIATHLSDNLQQYINVLFTVYREAFSDLCMVKLLGLSMYEYIKVIVASRQYETHDNWSDEPHRYIRYYVVTQVMQRHEVKDWKDEEFSIEWIDRHDKVSAAVQKLYKQITDCHKNGMKNGTLFNLITMTALQEYMDEAYERLQEIDSNELKNKYRQLIEVHEGTSEYTHMARILYAHQFYRARIRTVAEANRKRNKVGRKENKD